VARAPSSSHALFSLSLKGARLTSASSPAALAPPRQSRPDLTDREVFEAMKHDVQAFFRHSLAPSGRRASPTPTFGLTRSVRVGTLLCARHRCVHARARWHAHTRTCFALRIPGDDRPRQHDGKNRQSHKPSEPRSQSPGCVRACVCCVRACARAYSYVWVRPSMYTNLDVCAACVFADRRPVLSVSGPQGVRV